MPVNGGIIVGTTIAANINNWSMASSRLAAAAVCMDLATALFKGTQPEEPDPQIWSSEFDSDLRRQQLPTPDCPEDRTAITSKRKCATGDFRSAKLANLLHS